MMVKGDTQMAADVWQARGIDAPASTSQLHGTEKRLNGHGQTIMLTAMRKHPAIEWCVMGHKKLGPIHIFQDLGPGLGERRLVADIVPVQSMDMSERELAARRANQEGPFGNDAPALHIDKTYGAGAGPAMIGRFEIDGEKCAHWHPVFAGLRDGPR